MAKFQYVAVDSGGKEHKGQIDAENQQEAGGSFGGQDRHFRGFGPGGALPVVSGQRAGGILQTPGGGGEFGFDVGRFESGRNQQRVEVVFTG